MPSLYGSAGGANRKLRELYARDSGGTTRKLRELWGRDAGGANRKIFSAGARLASAPFIDSFSFGYAGETWSRDQSRSTLDFSPGSLIRFNMFMTARGVASTQTLGQMIAGVIVPIDLGRSVNFVADQPCLRIDTSITGLSGNNLTDSDKNNHSVSWPDHLAFGLGGDGLNYNLTSETIEGGRTDYPEAYIYQYPITNIPLTGNSISSYSSQYIYLRVYFFTSSRKTSSSGTITQFVCGIPNRSVTIIGSDGTEYPVDFE